MAGSARLAGAARPARPRRHLRPAHPQRQFYKRKEGRAAPASATCGSAAASGCALSVSYSPVAPMTISVSPTVAEPYFDSAGTSVSKRSCGGAGGRRRHFHDDGRAWLCLSADALRAPCPRQAPGS